MPRLRPHPRSGHELPARVQPQLQGPIRTERGRRISGESRTRAAVAAFRGEITDPRIEGKPPDILLPYRFMCDRTGIVAPAEDPAEVGSHPGAEHPARAGGRGFRGFLRRGRCSSSSATTSRPTTSARRGVEAITYRTNMPALADFTFRRVDETFASRARERRAGGVIVGAKTYRPGFRPRAGGHLPDDTRRPRRHRQELCENPPGEPHQLGHPALDVQ